MCVWVTQHIVLTLEHIVLTLEISFFQGFGFRKTTSVDQSGFEPSPLLSLPPAAMVTAAARKKSIFAAAAETGSHPPPWTMNTPDPSPPPSGGAGRSYYTDADRDTPERFKCPTGRGLLSFTSHLNLSVFYGVPRGCASGLCSPC